MSSGTSWRSAAVIATGSMPSSASDLGRRDGMRDVRLAGGALLLRVRLDGEVERPLDGAQVGLGVMRADRAEEGLAQRLEVDVDGHDRIAAGTSAVLAVVLDGGAPVATRAALGWRRDGRRPLRCASFGRGALARARGRRHGRGPGGGSGRGGGRACGGRGHRQECSPDARPLLRPAQGDALSR